MNHIAMTAGNIAVAGAVGTGAAYGGSKIAPDTIKPEDPTAWMVAGGVGGAVVATQIAPRVFVSQLDRALGEFHKYDETVMHSLARKDVPIGDVPKVIAGYIPRHQAVESAMLHATSNGAFGGIKNKAGFVGIAAAGALAGVGTVVGANAAMDKFRA